MSVMDAFNLTATEARVLGSLIEKDITTPDYYPLSLNALVNACNQKSNREPVMELSDDQVRDALQGLQERRLAGPAAGAESRVSKYEHRLQEVLNLPRAETAVLCVLLLRGAQTPGELRGRTERLFRFEHLDDVQSTLQRLIDREPPLARALPRQPGTKETRYVELMSKESLQTVAPPLSPVFGDRVGLEVPDVNRLATIEQELVDLRRRVGDLEQQLATFRRQFE